MFQFNVMTQIGFKHVLLQSWLLNLMLLLWLMIKSTFLLPKKLRHFLRLFSKIELFNICLDISNDDLDDFQQNIYPFEKVNWVYFKILFNCRNMWEVTAISYAIQASSLIFNQLILWFVSNSFATTITMLILRNDFILKQYHF